MHIVWILLLAWLVMVVLLLLFATLFKQHVHSKVQVMNSFYLWEKEMKQD